VPLSVNGQEVTQQAIDFELRRLLAFYSEHMPEAEVRAQMDILRKKAREQAIGAKLLIDEARRVNIPVPPADIETGLKQVVETAGGRKHLEAILKKQNLTEVQIRKSIEEGRRVDLLVQRITEAVPEPTEDELKAHFEAHSAEYVKPEQIQARHILIAPHSPSEQDRAVAKSRLLDIRSRIKEGADFGDMAAAYSDCPSGKKSGGSLGWVVRGAMVPEFENVLFAMQDGDISDVVETPFGFHVIARTATEAASASTYDDVHAQVRDFVVHARRGEAIAAYVHKLREHAVIEDDA
jgi:parvulin-like peptidyl-prolyl isomerase